MVLEQEIPKVASWIAPAGVWKAIATDSRPGSSSPRSTIPLSRVAEKRDCFTGMAGGAAEEM